MRPVHVKLPFETLARFVVDALAYIGPDERIAAWSEAAAELTGIPAARARGLALDDLFASVEPALQANPLPNRIQLRTRDERRRCLHASVLSLDDGWLLSFGHAQRFAQIDELKGQIVASVSHELKTPIATIKAFATTLRNNGPALEHTSDEYLATIEREADRLNCAVDDLLTAGRVDVEYLPEHRRTLALDVVLDMALDRLEHAAARRILRRTSGITIAGDCAQLAAAFAHVIENALKFSVDASEVVIEARTDRDATLVRIIDRGIGIPEEQMPYIFDCFYRGDARLTAPSGGSGLGLYIARSIVRAHGGTIEIESTSSAGTVVSVRIPVRG